MMFSNPFFKGPGVRTQVPQGYEYCSQIHWKWTLFTNGMIVNHFRGGVVQQYWVIPTLQKFGWSLTTASCHSSSESHLKMRYKLLPFFRGCDCLFPVLKPVERGRRTLLQKVEIFIQKLKYCFTFCCRIETLLQRLLVQKWSHNFCRPH